MITLMMEGSMVRKPKALKQATDTKPDPAFQDLYIPRKEGDPTGQSQIINEQEDRLDYSMPDAAGQAVAAQAVQAARPMALGEPTRLPNEPNTAGISQGPGVGRLNQSPANLNLDAYLAGLMNKYNDPIILELIEQEDAAPLEGFTEPRSF